MTKPIFNRNYHKKYLSNVVTPQTHNNFLYQQGVQLISEQLNMFSKVFANGLFYGFGDIQIGGKCQNLSYGNIVNDYRAQIIYDEEKVTLPSDCYDLIISNLSLHFVNNIEDALKNYVKSLKPNGLFLAVIFGENTLTELRQTALNTDIKYYNSVFPKVIPMITTKDFARLALKAGFSVPVSTIETVDAVFQDFNSLLQTIRSAGQINSLNNKPRHFYGHKYFSYLQKEYLENFSYQDKNSQQSRKKANMQHCRKVKATFDYVILSASKNI